MKKQKITLNIKKNINQNASDYFEKAKKAKKKLTRTKEELEKNKTKLKNLQTQTKQTEQTTKKEPQTQKTKKEWYEKYRWFISSEGFLCIGGKDATTNEIIIKKHTNPEETVFHTEIPGSPFFVIKNSDKKQPTKKTLEETATTTCSFSKAWKLGISTTEVYHIKAKQVTKKAKAGEYLKKGAFMITGKRNYITAETKLATGLTKNNKIMTADENAIKKHCKKYIKLIPGRKKTSEIAKKISKELNYKDLDEIIRKLPPGTTETQK